MLILERILFRNESYSGNIYNLKEDQGSYIRSFCSCEKKAWKKFRLVRVSNPDLCDTGAALNQLS